MFSIAENVCHMSVSCCNICIDMKFYILNCSLRIIYRKQIRLADATLLLLSIVLYNFSHKVTALHILPFNLVALL